MPFRVPKIKGCCCLSLETGSKIIGCIHMIFFVLAIALPVLLTSMRNVITVVQGMIYETLFLNFGWCAVLMLYGVIKKDHVLMFPWIILHTIFFVFVLNAVFTQVVYFGLMDFRQDAITVETVLTLFQAYSLMVVYNHYRELKEQRPEATA